MANVLTQAMPKFLVLNTVSFFQGLPVLNAFSLYGAGNMSLNYGDPKVAENNFSKFCSTVGVSAMKRVHIRPAHGSNVVKTDSYHAGAVVVCDGLITAEKDLMLSLFPADCFPVIITNEESDFVGLIHGGRKSVEKGIIVNAVELAKGFVKSPADLLVVIGPGIRCCCYGTDLQLEITEQLLKMDVRKIFFSGVCTYCSDDKKEKSLFFSHRRSENSQKTDNPEPEGRFAAIAALR